MNIRIRPESAADVASIKTVTASAFLHAPHTSHTEHLIVDALRAAGALTVSLVAEANGSIIGHVAASPVSIAEGPDGWFGLGPISVLPEYQRCGIGTRLMHEAIEQLRKCGARGCVVLGDPAFYGRFGFRVNPGLDLPGVPREYFLALCFGTLAPHGTVGYHAAFDAPD